MVVRAWIHSKEYSNALSLNPSVCLQIYGKELISDLEDKHIAIDGKQLKGSKRKTGSTHILSAWVDEIGLNLTQETIAEKLNALQAIPEVLDSLDLSGAVISIDAMGTQTNIAKQIIQSEADYILSLKGNQKHLYEDVQDCFTGQYTCHRYEILEEIMIVLRSGLIPHYWLQRSLMRGKYGQW